MRLPSLNESNALIIMNSVNLCHKEVMNKMGVPLLDIFYDQVEMLIWKRLITIIDNHTPRVAVKLDSHILMFTKRFSHFLNGLKKGQKSNT